MDLNAHPAITTRKEPVRARFIRASPDGPSRGAAVHPVHAGGFGRGTEFLRTTATMGAFSVRHNSPVRECRPWLAVGSVELLVPASNSFSRLSHGAGLRGEATQRTVISRTR